MSVNKDAGNRSLLLCEDISEKSVAEIAKEIIRINYEDDQRESEYKDFSRQKNPIILTISSYGGSVYCGLSLYDIIEGSKTPVHTVVSGKAMSFGLILLLAGHKRFSHKNATIMYHELAYGCWGKLEEHKINIDESKRLQDEILDKIVLEKTLITKDQLSQVRERKREWYISAIEAKKLGIVEEIL